MVAILLSNGGEPMIEHATLELPPSQDGFIYLSGDSTLKERKSNSRISQSHNSFQESENHFGLDMVLLLANWDKYRVPLALSQIDIRKKGHQNILFREMLARFNPPLWAQKVVVLGVSGFAAKETFQLIKKKNFYFAFSLPKTWKVDHETSLREILLEAPNKLYQRISSVGQDGKRKQYWVFSHHCYLDLLGDVTIVFSKKREEDSHKKVKCIVTNLNTLEIGDILSIYSRRWGLALNLQK